VAGEGIEFFKTKVLEFLPGYYSIENMADLNLYAFTQDTFVHNMFLIE